MTTKSGRGGSSSVKRSFDFKKAATVVVLENPNETDLKTLVETLYPRCKEATERLVACYQVRQRNFLCILFNSKVVTIAYKSNEFGDMICLYKMIVSISKG